MSRLLTTHLLVYISVSCSLLVAAHPSKYSSFAEKKQGDGSDKAQGVDVDLLFSTPEGERGLDDIQLAPLVAACVAMTVGSVMCFAGSRILHYAALGCAFFDGAFTTSAILEHALDHAQWEGVVSWTFFFLGGILCCLLVISLEHGYAICVGVTAGLMVAFTCMTTFGYLILPMSPNVVLFVFLGLLGPSGGVLAVRMQPTSLVLTTSWIGCNMVTWGVGYFFGEYPNATTIEQFRTDEGKYTTPRAWWGYFAGSLAFFIVGTCVQAQMRYHKQKHAAVHNGEGEDEESNVPHHGPRSHVNYNGRTGYMYAQTPTPQFLAQGSVV